MHRDDAVRLRHSLVHAYFDINLDILWRTVQDDLPALLEILGPPIRRQEL
jgi:uncharacterized protein with HEPN domain